MTAACMVTAQNPGLAFVSLIPVTTPQLSAQGPRPTGLPRTHPSASLRAGWGYCMPSLSGPGRRGGDCIRRDERGRCNVYFTAAPARLMRSQNPRPVSQKPRDEDGAPLTFLGPSQFSSGSRTNQFPAGTPPYFCSHFSSSRTLIFPCQGFFAREWPSPGKIRSLLGMPSA
jgi:hypothetical protein